MNEKVKNEIDKAYWYEQRQTLGNNNMKLKPYPEYKNSGVQWIGEIPESWEVHKLKRFSRIETGNTPSKEDERYYEDGNFPWIRPDELKEFQPISDSNIKLNKDGKKLARKIPKNSILVCCIGSLGKIGIAGKELATNQQINSIILNEERCKFQFVKYIIFNSKKEMERIGNANVVSIVNKSQQGEISYCLPPFPQQTTIAKFLDKKTAEISKLIEKDKKLIELLKEKRTALINHAVTKGLDPNANMKDSGIDWIGEIPEGWEVNKIKNTNYVKGRIGWHGLTSEEYQDEGAFLVTGTDFFNGHIDWSSCHHVSWERYKEDPYIHLKENDVLITKDGTIGKVALIEDLPDKATLNSGVFVIRPLKKKHISRFMFWILNSLVFEKFFDYVKRGATISHLYQETFERFIFPIPSLDEQKAIAEYLDKETLKIDKTIHKIQKKIKLLEEYKKSLIHHTVTGKVDVRKV